MLVSIIIGFTYIYLIWNRKKTIEGIAEAICIYKDELRLTKLASGVLLPTVPLWVWPLGKSSYSITREDFLEYLDLRAHKLYTIIANVLIVVVVFVGIAVTFAQWRISSTYHLEFYKVRAELNSCLKPSRVVGFSPIKQPSDNCEWNESPLRKLQKEELARVSSSLSFSGHPVGDAIICGFFLS